jgi:hypothetical protein
MNTVAIRRMPDWAPCSSTIGSLVVLVISCYLVILLPELQKSLTG